MFPEPNIYAFAPHIFCIQNWKCNLYYLNLAYLIARSALFIIQLLPICCRMRHEVPNLQSIYLLKMYHNPFTLFLIAGKAHAKCRCYAILAILPFVTLLIAEDEARSAELVQAILLSYPFFVYSLETFCFLNFFPAYRWYYAKAKFSYLFLYIILPWRSTKSMLYFGFLEPFLI